MSLPVTECNESSLQFQYTNLWCGVSGQQHSCSIVEWSVVSWVITLKKLVLLLTTLGQPLSPEVHSVSTGMGAMSYHWQQLRRLVIQFYYCRLEVYLGGEWIINWESIQPFCLSQPFRWPTEAYPWLANPLLFQKMPKHSLATLWPPFSVYTRKQTWY